MTKDLPKVSIGLVVYNQEDFIEACLDSIRVQTYNNIELVISDDCSPDSTREVLKDYDARYPGFITQLLFPPKNLGVSKNLNYVLGHLTGDYICMFAGDDIMMPTKIAKQVQSLEASPDAGMCFTNMEWFNPEQGKTWFKHFGLLQKAPQSIEDLIKDNTLPSPTFFYRRNAIIDSGYDERISVICDYKIALDVYAEYSTTYIDEVLTQYCKHSKSITAQSYYSQERRTLYHILNKKYQGIYDKALGYNLAMCRYALIMDNLKRGKLKRSLLIYRRLLPYSLSSVKWLLRNMLILKAIILTIINRR